MNVGDGWAANLAALSFFKQETVSLDLMVYEIMETDLILLTLA